MMRIFLWTFFLSIVCFAVGGRAYHSTGALIGLIIGVTLGISIGTYFNQKSEKKIEPPV